MGTDLNRFLSIAEVQRASFDVLVEIDKICRDLNLAYTLSYGTLIGAIRHKGFIPWDDDVDIIMPRTDLEKLKNHFKTSYSGNLKWCDRTTIKNYPYCIPRVSDFRYRYKTSLRNQKDFDMGVFVDVYPLDNYCNTTKEALKLGRKVWFKNRMFDIYLNPSKTKGFAKTMIRNIIYVFVRLIHGADWNLRIDEEINALIKKHTNDNNQIVGVISQVEWRELMKKEWFSVYEEIKFEGRSFKVCAGYRELLTSIYGDYMQLPPEEKRVQTHDYTMTIR
ncbi:MAG: LicD family protein [Salinivirgaceae bacterium]|nr:LicD family protein [Salinivirgaceae bacterium]